MTFKIGEPINTSNLLPVQLTTSLRPFAIGEPVSSTNPYPVRLSYDDETPTSYAITVDPLYQSFPYVTVGMERALIRLDESGTQHCFVSLWHEKNASTAALCLFEGEVPDGFVNVRTPDGSPITMANGMKMIAPTWLVVSNQDGTFNDMFQGENRFSISTGYPIHFDDYSVAPIATYYVDQHTGYDVASIFIGDPGDRRVLRDRYGKALTTNRGEYIKLGGWFRYSNDVSLP